MKNIPLYEVRPIRDLKELLNSSANLYSDKAAFLVKSNGIEGYSPISYRQFKNDVDALGTALVNLGLKGKRIALIGENRYEWAVSYLATVNGTGIVIPLDKELPQNEIESLLTRSRANAVIFSGNVSSQITTILHNLNSVDFFINMDAKEDTSSILSYELLLEKGYAHIKGGNSDFIDTEIDSEAMSALLFTSGTTDTSKAVMLSHGNISSNLMAMCSMLYIDQEDIFLSVLPIHHTYECTCGFLCPIYRGCTVAFCEGLRHIPKNLVESKSTIMLGVPLIFEAIYRRIWDQAAKTPGTVRKLKIGIKLSNFLRKFKIDVTKKLFAPIHDTFGGHLRLFISGAAGIDPLVAKGFRELGINFVQGYGLTECSPIVGLNRNNDFKDSAAGIPLPNLEVKIHNPGADGVGEIIVKGPSVMLGYYENPDATAKVLIDGWFYTGDLAYIDKDKFLHITGRKKNVIVTKNGKNIYPEEIETLLNRSRYIAESLVTGSNDSISGDLTITAAIVPDYDKIHEQFGETISPEAVHNLIQGEIKAINKGLIIYKHVKDFHLRDVEFAKTTSKKIKRYVEVE